MGLFSKLFGKDQTQQAKPASKDLRNFERYVIGFPPMKVDFSSQQGVEIHDLSYGGFSIKADQLNQLVQTGSSLPIVFHAHHITFAGDVELRHVNKGLCGFMFTKKSTEALSKMQRIIERVKAGATLQQIDQSMLNQTPESAQKTLLRGEGPTDVMFELSGNTIKSLSLYYRARKDYWNLIWTPDSLQAAVAEDQDLQGTKNFRKIVPVPKDVIADSLLILSGVTQSQLRPLFEPVARDLQAFE